MHIERTSFLQVVAGSRKNRSPGKPNEDAFWLGPRHGVFCVADGITRARSIDGTYPNPSPASAVAEIVVSAVATMCDGTTITNGNERRLLNAFRLANRNIRDYIREQRKKGISLETDIPGAVATVLALEEHSAIFVHLGDCSIVHFSQGALSQQRRLTLDQTAAVRKWLHESQSTPWETRLDLMRNTIRNNGSHPLAFGVLSGEDAGLQFVQTGRIEVARGDMFVLCTDGLEIVLDKLATDSRLRTLLGLRDVDGILDYAETLDDQLQRRSDDKTLLLIDILV